MANNLTQDPLKIDTNGTVDVRIRRIRAVKFDAGAAATASIVDGQTGHILWSTTGGTFDEINLTVPGNPPLVDVNLSAGTVYLYEGSGPQ